MGKLAVGYGWSSPFIWTAFTDCSLNMAYPDGWDVRWFRGSGPTPARRHIHFLEQALDWEADLLCFVGSDQVHPEDMLPRLVKRIDEGCDVISALVPTRGTLEPFGPISYKPFQRCAWRRFAPQHLELVDPAEGDLIQIDFIGSGVLMFKAKDLLKLKQPWFRDKLVDVRSQEYDHTTDVLFTYRLQQEASCKIWLDTTIDVEHLHAFPITKNWEGLEICSGTDSTSNSTKPDIQK